jgi:hypothetical protein
VTPPRPHLALDNQAIAALEKLGFAVGDEKAAARIGGATVTVKRVSDLRAPEFEIAIVLPCGRTLITHTRRRELLVAVDEEPDGRKRRWREGEAR